MECLRTRIFAGANSSLVEGPERVALKLLRSVVDSTRGCSLIPEEGYFRVRGTSGLVYEIQSCSRGAGAHGSRFKMRCIGPDGEEKRSVSPWEEGPHRDDICIRESVGSRLPLGDVLVQAILTASQDKESASSGIQSIRNNIANWQNRLEQSRIRRRRREDPVGAAFRNVERIADMLRHDWIHRRVRRASASFPSLWSAMIRAPTGSVLRFTSLVNAENSIGGPNVIFDGVTTRFRTDNRHERQIVRSMLLGSGWTRQTQEERRLGVSQIWHRTSRPDDNELQEAVIRFCELIEGLVQVNGRRAPLAPENLEQIFEADSEVYNTALLPGSRGLIR